MTSLMKTFPVIVKFQRHREIDVYSVLVTLYDQRQFRLLQTVFGWQDVVVQFEHKHFSHWTITAAVTEEELQKVYGSFNSYYPGWRGSWYALGRIFVESYENHRSQELHPAVPPNVPKPALKVVS